MKIEKLHNNETLTYVLYSVVNLLTHPKRNGAADDITHKECTKQLAMHFRKNEH